MIIGSICKKDVGRIYVEYISRYIWLGFNQDTTICVTFYVIKEATKQEYLDTIELSKQVFTNNYLISHGYKFFYHISVD